MSDSWLPRAREEQELQKREARFDWENNGLTDEEYQDRLEWIEGGEETDFLPETNPRLAATHEWRRYEITDEQYEDRLAEIDEYEMSLVDEDDEEPGNW